MDNSYIMEGLGILASIIIVCALIFKTSSYKGTLRMRSINIVGSAIFCVYGLLVPAYAVVLLNFLSIVINICHIAFEYRTQHKKDK